MNNLPQGALDLIDQLDAEGLAMLIAKLESDLEQDDARLVALKKRMEELQRLKEALAEENKQKIQAIRTKLGLPAQ